MIPISKECGSSSTKQWRALFVAYNSTIYTYFIFLKWQIAVSFWQQSHLLRNRVPCRCEESKRHILRYCNKLLLPLIIPKCMWSAEDFFFFFPLKFSTLGTIYLLQYYTWKNKVHKIKWFFKFREETIKQNLSFKERVKYNIILFSKNYLNIKIRSSNTGKKNILFLGKKTYIRPN